MHATLILLALVSADLTGKCVSVHDGDTITVLDPQNVQHKIRLRGIDAPESKQPYGTKSREALAGKVFGQAVIIQVQTIDRYGRSVGLVWVGTRNINLEMVQEGFAWHYAKYDPKALYLRDAENAARTAQKGLWRDAAVPPWDFRREQKVKRKAAKSTLRAGFVAVKSSLKPVATPHNGNSFAVRHDGS